MQKIIFTIIILQLAVSHLFAQSDEQVLEELKNVFIEVIKTDNDSQLEPYKITVDDMEEIIEAIAEEKMEEARSEILEKGRVETLVEKYNKHFKRNIDKLQDEDVQLLDPSKIEIEYKTGIEKDAFPQNEMAEAKIYQPEKEPIININLLKLKRGWVIVRIDI